MHTRKHSRRAKHARCKTYVKLVENDGEEDEAGNQNRKVERVANDSGRGRRRDDGKQHNDCGRPQIPVLRLESIKMN